MTVDGSTFPNTAGRQSRRMYRAAITFAYFRLSRFSRHSKIVCEFYFYFIIVIIIFVYRRLTIDRWGGRRRGKNRDTVVEERYTHTHTQTKSICNNNISYAANDISQMLVYLSAAVQCFMKCIDYHNIETQANIVWCRTCAATISANCRPFYYVLFLYFLQISRTQDVSETSIVRHYCILYIELFYIMQMQMFAYCSFTEYERWFWSNRIGREAIWMPSLAV